MPRRVRRRDLPLTIEQLLSLREGRARHAIPSALADQRSLREGEFLEILPIGRTSLRGLQNAGLIPKPIKKYMPGATRPVTIYSPEIMRATLAYLTTEDDKAA